MQLRAMPARRRIWFVGMAMLLLALACGSDEARRAGEEGGACFGNGTCLFGLGCDPDTGRCVAQGSSGDGGPPVGVCPSGELSCGADCVDPDTDRSHCGGCDLACDDGFVCNGAGDCALSCQPGLVDCGGRCLDPDTDRGHCGASGDCTGASSGAVCADGFVCDGAGQCAVSCQVNRLSCAGACVDPDTDRNYCGASDDCAGANNGEVCDDGFVCSLGACALSCQSQLVDCDGACIDPEVDGRYCGAKSDCKGANAGELCGSSEVCSGGSCTSICQAGYVMCGGSCIDPTLDEGFCGAAGNCQGASAGEVCAVDERCDGTGHCAPSLTVTAASTVINTYAYLISDEPMGDSTLSVESASGFAAGDLIMVVQMQHNTESVVGRFEFVEISAVSGNNLTLSSSLTRGYFSGTPNLEPPNARVAQVVRVPRYIALTIAGGGSIVASAWNGKTGGVVALRASDVVRVQGAISADAAGYRGGSAPDVTVIQGESYAGFGKSCLGGDGSCNVPNRGGGGAPTPVAGPSGGAGGGGYGVMGSDGVAGGLANGMGGGTYGVADLSRLCLGSGGGKGEFPRSAPGGGIVFLDADILHLDGGTISADGGGAVSEVCCVEGGPGGGAGGSALLRARVMILGSGNVHALGGAGGASDRSGGAGGGGRIRLETLDPSPGTSDPAASVGTY
jgi:hypothetical protein